MDVYTSVSTTVDADALISYWGHLGADTIHPADHDAIGDEDFATDILPVPWAGPLANAKVYFLFLNPGLSPLDRSYERTRPEFVTALRENLNGGHPYVYLQDRFTTIPAMHGLRAPLARTSARTTPTTSA